MGGREREDKVTSREYKGFFLWALLIFYFLIKVIII